MKTKEHYMHKGIMLAKRCDRKTIFKTRHNSARNSDEDVFLGTGGGGPKADLLRKMIAQEGLEGRVEMVGAVPHEKARDLLVSLPSTLSACLSCLAMIGQHLPVLTASSCVACSQLKSSRITGQHGHCQLLPGQLSAYHQSSCLSAVKTLVCTYTVQPLALGSPV